MLAYVQGSVVSVSQQIWTSEDIRKVMANDIREFQIIFACSSLNSSLYNQLTNPMNQRVSSLSYARNSPTPPTEDDCSLPFSQNPDTGPYPDKQGSRTLPTPSQPVP